jgi:hypothetical protein
MAFRVSPRRARATTVARKLRPPLPKTQPVRTTEVRAEASCARRSPSSFAAP